ncbi:hypothetical protein Tco_1199066 [Tanacetum coccineum]
MDKRKKHFARLKAEEQRRKPLTKAQKRNQMCTYLKNMAGFTHNQLKNKSFNEVQKAFDKTMSWIDSFVPVDSEVVKGTSKSNVPDVRKVDIYFCKPGGLGKQKKLSFIMSEKTRKLQKLKQVHIEGYGPTFIASI